jgi:hypothetical protein
MRIGESSVIGAVGVRGEPRGDGEDGRGPTRTGDPLGVNEVL